MTQMQDYSIGEYVFLYNDERYLSLPWYSRYVYRTIWDYHAHERSEKTYWKSIDRLASQINLLNDCPLEQILESLQLIFTLKLALFVDGHLLVFGVRGKHAPLRSWGYSLTPEECKLFKGDKTPLKRSESIPSTDSIMPMKGEELTLKGAKNAPCNFEKSPDLRGQEQRGDDMTGTEMTGTEEPAARDTTHLPPPGWVDVYKPDYMKRPKRCPLHGQLSKIKLRETNSTSDGKRRITPDGEKYIAEIYEALSHGDDDIDRQVAAALQMQLELKPLQALKAVAIDPQRLCEYLYASITEAENMGAYLMKMVAKMPDIGDTPVYAAVKKLLFGGNGKRGEGKKAAVSDMVRQMDGVL